jgi:hypothetical protein
VSNPGETFREFAPVLLLLAAVVWGLWDARRRIRPWFLYLYGGLAAVSLPMTFYLVSGAQSGEFSGWGGLGMILILLPAVFIAAVSVTALATLAILIPRYGFCKLTPEQRAAERARRRSPEGRQELALFKFKVSVVMLAVVLLALTLRGYFSRGA